MAGKDIMPQMITRCQSSATEHDQVWMCCTLSARCCRQCFRASCRDLHRSQYSHACMQAIYRGRVPHLLPIPPGHLKVPLVTWLGSLPPVGWQQHAHVLRQVRQTVGGQAPGLCQGLAAHPLVQQAQGLRVQELVQHAAVCWQHIQWRGDGCRAPGEQSAACSRFTDPPKQVQTPAQAASESRVCWGATACPCRFQTYEQAGAVLMAPFMHEPEGPKIDTHLAEPRDMTLPVAVGTGSPLHSCTLSGLKWPPAHGSPPPCSRHQARAGSHNGGTAVQAECTAPVSSRGQTLTGESQRAAPAWCLSRLAAADWLLLLLHLLQHRFVPGALAQCLCP